MKKFICNIFLFFLLNRTRFVTFDVHFMALNKLHELGLPSSDPPSFAWFDSDLFLRRTDKGIILHLLYVDDMIITGDDLDGIQQLKDFLS